MDKEEKKIVTPEQATKLYSRIKNRFHLPKEFRKGKTSEEIQNMRKSYFVKWLHSNNIFIETEE